MNWYIKIFPIKYFYQLGACMKSGLYANIHKKRERIKDQKAAGKPAEKMRSVGSKGAPTAKAFKDSAKTAKKK
jgi:hypothetical protein